MGSVKFERCPEATNTAFGIIWAASISTISSRFTRFLRQSSTYLFLSATPSGP